MTEKTLNALEINKKLKEEWVVNLKRTGENPRIIHLNLDQAKKIKEIIEGHFNKSIRQHVNHLGLFAGSGTSFDDGVCLTAYGQKVKVAMK